MVLIRSIDFFDLFSITTCRSSLCAVALLFISSPFVLYTRCYSTTYSSLFQPSRDPPLPRGTLIILDRTIDHLSPFLNEFTYQAMMTDLLNVEESPLGLKYSYEYVQEDGLTASKEIVLDEQDSVYTSIRHMHIANTTERLIESFNEFIAQNKGSGGYVLGTAVDGLVSHAMLLKQLLFFFFLPGHLVRPKYEV